ncbi:MAG: prepilin-type N-terminal cleavage/methylation domain-containing protein [Actinomycetota bacterium]|nr:prepilin-type N-terminal cleavage/methylation domain-containing protein [Actinomycetota bacterium]
MRLGRRIRAQQTGMTLIELMIGMSIALVVTFASFALLDRATTASNEIADRQDAIQRGRQAMDLMTRQLRSQVCLGETAEPISYGDATTITFYADLSDGSEPVARHTLTFVAPSGGVPGRIREDVFAGAGAYPDLEFGPTPTKSRVLLNGARRIELAGQSQPLFRYFAFQPGSPTGDLQELAVPLTAGDASRTIMVRIEFVSMPERTRPRDKDATTLQDSVYVRLADPTQPLEGPRCI